MYDVDLGITFTSMLKKPDRFQHVYVFGILAQILWDVLMPSLSWVSSSQKIGRFRIQILTVSKGTCLRTPWVRVPSVPAKLDNIGYYSFCTWDQTTRLRREIYVYFWTIKKDINISWLQMIISLSFYLTALLFRVLTHQKGIFLFTAISQVVKSYT